MVVVVVVGPSFFSCSSSFRPSSFFFGLVATNPGGHSTAPSGVTCGTGYSLATMMSLVSV